MPVGKKPHSDLSPEITCTNYFYILTPEEIMCRHVQPMYKSDKGVCESDVGTLH
jgi:hypothetical protein